VPQSGRKVFMSYTPALSIDAALKVAKSPEHFAPIHRRMFAILHFDPVLAATAAIGSIR
jgi:hypothetical protein